MSIEDMSDRVKTALLMCAAKSEELEEMSKQLTVQKLRSQLSIEAIVKKAEEQLMLVKKNLITDLNKHHDKGQAKIQEQQLMVLKHNMELSSALVKEAANDELCDKIEKSMNIRSSGIKVVFVPSTNFENISSSDFGFFQLGTYLPTDLILSFSSANSFDDTQLVTCTLSSCENLQEIVDFLKVTVRMYEEEEEVASEHTFSEGSSVIIKISFSAKYSGKYCLYVSLYGEQVQGSPVVVEVTEDSVNYIFDVKSMSKNIAIDTKNMESCNHKSVEHENLEGSCEITKSRILNVKKENENCNQNTNKGEQVAAQNVKSGHLDTTSQEADIETLCNVEVGVNSAEIGDNISEVNNEVVSLEDTSQSACEPIKEDVAAEKAASPLLPAYSVGVSCLARWSEDNVWYRAKVEKWYGGLYDVTFVDYGNTASVASNEVVSMVADLPKEELDMVDSMVWKWTVGKAVIAKWSEDETWYNGIIQSVVRGSYNVTFVDYGNTEVVGEENIVETYEDIPVEELEFVDSCVSKVKVTEESGHIIDIKDVSTDSVPPAITESTDRLEALGSPIHEDFDDVAINAHHDADVEDCVVGKYSVGSVCIAEWSEDGIWYNSTVKRVIEGGFYEVIFHDYGNEATVAELKLKGEAKDIPVGAKLDELVLKGKKGVVVTEDVDPASEEKGLEGDKSDSLCGIVDQGGDNNLAEEIPIKTNSLVSNHADKPTLSKDQKDFQWTPTVGSLCCAKWSDRVWYNARVDDLLPSGKEALVTFTDYGNSDKVAVVKLVQNRDFIPKGARINTFVEEGASKCILRDNLIVGDVCVTLWSQDDTWYNAVIVKVDKVNEMVEVEFTDYGNLDIVSMNDVYRKLSDVVLDRPYDKMTVDPNVYTVESKLHSDSIMNENADVVNDDLSQVPGVDPPVLEEFDAHIPCSLKSMVSKDLNGKVLLNAMVVNIIPCTEDVTAMVMVQDVLVTVSSTENSIKMWNRDGGFLRSVSGKTSFQHPTDAIVIKAKGFLVLDRIGLHMFDYNGNFLKTLFVDKLDTCRGMVLDSTGRVVVINRCFSGDQGMLTGQGQTDILYIDVEKEKVVKRVEMIDILEDKNKSDCKALGFFMDKLFVVDSGLDCIYTLFHEDGEDQAEMYGSPGRGEGQFSGLAVVVVDDEGTLLISDSRNNRMQLVGSDWEFLGFVKVQPTPLSRPSCMCLDNDVRQLVVYNMGSNEIVRYALGKTS